MRKPGFSGSVCCRVMPHDLHFGINAFAIQGTAREMLRTNLIEVFT